MKFLIYKGRNTALRGRLTYSLVQNVSSFITGKENLISEKLITKCSFRLAESREHVELGVGSEVSDGEECVCNDTFGSDAG